MGWLSSSAVSTSVALVALASIDLLGYREQIDRAVAWLCGNQNSDGGWGDTDRSPSNYPATVLSVTALSLIDKKRYSTRIAAGNKFIEQFGDLQSLIDYYGNDRTFAVPILTVAAMAGLVSWKEVPVLPYEVVLFPRRFLRALRLPVVSYALPALCAVGMLGESRNPRSGLRGFIRARAKGKAFRMLADLQPESGGYLEAAPLTAFVASSLAGLGKSDHRVVRMALRFLVKSQREDGSWPIEENLAVWNTAIVLQALASGGADITTGEFEKTRHWYMQQQRGGDIFTESPAGGFAWTHLSGGVPDSDDTGAALVVLGLFGLSAQDARVGEAISWCRKVQNRDGGWPTFCKGWGKLPFDRSTVDVTAHVLIGLSKSGVSAKARMIRKGVAFLLKEQSSDGCWRSLWFGNECAKDKHNYTYATSQALEALCHAKYTEGVKESIEKGREWILRNQNSDGGWGPIKDIVSSPEETAFALTGILETGIDVRDDRVQGGILYLLKSQNVDGSWESTPIGLYFGQLWYYESIYAQAFPLRALSVWLRKYEQS